MIIDEKDYLEHYGKKGMRWGVRTKQDRADMLKRHAERRPTRGNIRKAQIAQRKADWKGPNAPHAKGRKIAAGVIAVAGGLAVAAMIKNGSGKKLSSVDTRLVSSGKDYILKSNDLGMHQLMSGVMNQVNAAR